MMKGTANLIWGGMKLKEDFESYGSNNKLVKCNCLLRASNNDHMSCESYMTEWVTFAIISYRRRGSLRIT